jgi:quinol monooxygenase YgiN
VSYRPDLPHRPAELDVAIRVIVELQAKPGRRDELRRLLERIITTEGSSQDGFLGSMRYEVLDAPNVLVEIADWESAETRDAHMRAAAATGAYAPLGSQAAVAHRSSDL